MSHTAHFVLLAVALVVNWGDRRAMALTLIVGLSVLVPFNQFTQLSNFYLVCALSETIVALLALRIDTRASNFIFALSMMLITCHVVGWHQDGRLPSNPYGVLAKLTEYAEIVGCMIFANPFLRLFRYVCRSDQ